MTVNVVKRMLGMDGGLCDQVREAAHDLASTARALRATVGTYNRAPDPFTALLTSVWNNHEFAKFAENAVDSSHAEGVGPRPISYRALGS